jgi:hypothetical protein
MTTIGFTNGSSGFPVPSAPCAPAQHVSPEVNVHVEGIPD